MQVTSGIALPRAAPPRGTGPQPRALRLAVEDLGTWFEARCPFGHLGLAVEPGGATAEHAAAAAVALVRVEPLLAALDDWIGLDLDWCWSSAAGPAAATQVTARWCGADGAAASLSLPWALLRALPAPEIVFDWPLVPAVLALERLAITLDELADLEPGGALLLPASSHAPWIGALRASGESTAGVPIDLSTPSRPRLAAPDTAEAPAAIDPHRIACELRLDLPLGVHATRLAGWRREGDAGELVRLAENALRATLWRLPTPLHAEHAVARGSLMPWGSGWALAIESVDGTPERGAETKD